MDAAKNLVDESTPTLKQNFNALNGFVNEDVVEQDSSIPRHSANQAIGLTKGNPRQLGTLQLVLMTRNETAVGPITLPTLL